MKSPGSTRFNKTTSLPRSTRSEEEEAEDTEEDIKEEDKDSTKTNQDVATATDIIGRMTATIRVWPRIGNVEIVDRSDISRLHVVQAGDALAKVTANKDPTTGTAIPMADTNTEAIRDVEEIMGDMARLLMTMKLSKITMKVLMMNWLRSLNLTSNLLVTQHRTK